jgi:hypothetical protein
MREATDSVGIVEAKDFKFGAEEADRLKLDCAKASVRSRSATKPTAG